jgi:RNA polymerase sigma-70 factor (ECF subfamily)
MSERDSYAREFAAQIEPHYPRLYLLAFRLCGSQADAEDLLQDVLIKLYERRQELSSIENLQPWLGRVLYNQFVDQARKHKRSPLVLVGDSGFDETADPHTEPVAARTQEESRSALERSLTRLSEDQRTLLLMHDAEGYSLPEIETLTGTPIGTLKSRLSRARARLRDLLRSLDPVDINRKGVSDAPGTRKIDGKKKEPFSNDQRVGR